MKKMTLTVLASLILMNVQAQSFYDLSTIQTIKITFAQSNWDALLDAEKARADGYIMAQSVEVNGVLFDSVGVKYKGNSTYNANQTKNPFHIELDTYKEHIYENYTDIKLSNVYNDPSFVREVLSYQILRQYMDAPLSNYANVYVNGNLIGLYSNSEAVSKKFVQSRYYSKNNTRVKCNPPAGAGPGTNDYPNLVYLGQDSTSYYDAYEMKSDAGWKELINLCDTLQNNIGSIEEILDVDRVLWMLAFDNILVNLDSYIGAFAQNYYLYRDDNKRFVSTVWDLNESFGRFSSTGSGNLNSTTAKQQMSHLLHEADANYPLVSQLLSVPMYKRMYLAHCKTILTENFSNNSYYTTGQTLQTLISSAVQADPNKFYTFANFQSNINSDVTSGGGPMASSAPGITNLMNGRSTYLLSQSDFTATEPTISSVTPSNQTPLLNETISITATVSNENDVYLGYRTAVTLPFTRVQMFDDGMHNDGASGDGVYGADLTVSTSEVQYYIYAENSTIGKFSPVRAEHEYHSIAAVAAINELVINEFMADNDNVITDQNGDYEDWIEIYNTTSDSIFLGDYYLTDDASDPTQFALPAEYIAAGGFKLIWASKDITKGTDHANFALGKSGEEIGLYKKNGTSVDTIDYILFGAQNTDESYGRSYDASPTWVVFTTSTPNASNGTIGIEEFAKTGLQVYPNPYQDRVVIDNPTELEATITIYSVLGQKLNSFVIQPFQSVELEDNYSAGMRLYYFETKNSKEVIRVVKR